MKKTKNFLIDRIKKNPKLIFRSKNKLENSLRSKTEEAMLFVINYKGRAAIFRHQVRSWKNNSYERYYAHLIAKELFPKYMLKPLGVEKREIEINRLKNTKEKVSVYGLVTQIVKNRSREYKDYQQKFYKQKKYNIPNHPHENWYSENVAKLASEIRSSGVLIEDNPINTINSRGKPIFVEVREIDTKKVMNYLKTKKITIAKRRKIEELIKKYEIYNPQI